MNRTSHWRILAIDLDGTLIGWNHKINDRDLDALRRARTADFHVAICTGRNSIESAGIISALALEDLGVFVNGGMVCRMLDGSAVHSTYIADELATPIIDFFGTHNHATLVLADDPASRLPTYCLTDHAPPHQATVDWLLYNRMHAEPVTDLPAHFKNRIVRLGVVVNPSEAPALHADLKSRFADKCATHSIYSPHYDCQILELFHPTVNKWTGLTHLASLTNARPDQIITIGDDINDLPMLQHAALSFAMANATPFVQQHAKRITPAQSACGVAHVIDSLLAGHLEP